MTTPRQTAYLEMLRMARELDIRMPPAVERDMAPRQPVTLCFKSLIVGALLGSGASILAMIAGVLW